MNNDLIRRGLAISYATSGCVRMIDGEDWIKVSEVKQSLKDVPKAEPKPYVIDSCDMNVFEPEKYMKERPQEEKQYTIKVNVPEDIRDKLIEELSKPRKVILDESETVTDCIIAYGDGFESARRLFERPHGEWIIEKDSVFEFYMKCSNCDTPAEWLDGGSQFLSNFCPNCGADMRKGEEE